MGGNDSSSPHCAPTSPLELPKWTNLLERSHCPAAPSRTRSESATSLDVTVQRQAPEKAPAWNSAPASPEQQAKSPRSSGSRSDGTVSPIRQYMECIEPQILSCAVVGDSGVGKTSLLLSYTTGKMPAGHNPTIYDKFSSKCLGLHAKMRPVLSSATRPVCTKNLGWKLTLYLSFLQHQYLFMEREFRWQFAILLDRYVTW